MGSKAEQKERTHATILGSAARLLRERGIAGASVADVMKAAGLTVGGFYAHFPSKEALVDEVLRRTALEMRQSLFAGLDDRPEADRIDLILRRYLSAAHRDEVARGCPFPAVVGEVGTTAAAHRDALAHEIAAIADELGPHIEAGPVPRRQMALALFALMYGGLSLARALRGTALSDEIIRACRAFGRIATRPRKDA